MQPSESNPGREALEIDLLLEAVFRLSGHDFREYAPASLRRRIRNTVRSEGLITISGLQERVVHDPGCMGRLLLALSVNATTLFRDPGFFLAFRNKVVPFLRTYPSVRIWHAGCATGEEVYSMAILLEEEGLYDRCRIYATDMSEALLKRAREAVIPLHLAEAYARDYAAAGGKNSFAQYYNVSDGSAILRSSLLRNIVFSPHNLAIDRSFNEFNVILCRNVMIYFKRPLQQRVHRLIYDSLARFGVLGLGPGENLQFTPHEKEYAPLEASWRLYRRTG